VVHVELEGHKDTQQPYNQHWHERVQVLPSSGQEALLVALEGLGLLLVLLPLEHFDVLLQNAVDLLLLGLHFSLVLHVEEDFINHAQVVHIFGQLFDICPLALFPSLGHDNAR